MKFSRILLVLVLILAGIGGYYLTKVVQNAEEPKFVRFENVKFKNVTLPPNLTITFTTDAVLSNPNDFALNISDVDFDVFVDGKKTTHVKEVLEIRMPEQTEFNVPLSFEVPIGKKEVFSKFKDMLSGAWKKQAIKIRSVGTITVRASKLRFDVPFDYEDEYKLEDYL